MAASMSVCLGKCLIFSDKSRYLIPTVYVQERFASRKGKRAAVMAKHKELKARKEEEMAKRGGKVPGFMKISKSSVNKDLLSKRRDVTTWLRSPPIDDVWYDKFHKKQGLEVEKAIEYHRESHHPTMYNQPDALLHATVELSLKTTKKTKFINKFTGTICYPHRFEYGAEKRVFAFCKSVEEQEKAIKAGAVQAGGINVIKGFQTGDISLTDFDHIVAHPDIIVELASIRGILKKYFPNKQAGNFGTDMATLVDKFKNGVEFSMNKDSFDEAYGWVDIVIGRLDMPSDHIEENLANVLKMIDAYAHPKFDNTFINDVILWSPPSLEKFYTQFWNLLPKYNIEDLVKRYTIIGPNNYAVEWAKPTDEEKLVKIADETKKSNEAVVNEIPKIEKRTEPDFFRYIP